MSSHEPTVGIVGLMLEQTLMLLARRFEYR